MSLVESSTIIEQTGPLKTSSLPCDAYVLAVAVVGSYYAVSASAPSHKIFCFDRPSLQVFQSFEGHAGGTTSLRAVDSLAGVNQRAIISSGKDGVVRVWDDRTGAAAIESTCSVRNVLKEDVIATEREPRYPAVPFEGKQRTLLSCDVSSDGLTVVAGTELQEDDALVLYWDPRHPSAPLRKHTSTHADDITTVNFSRSSERSRNLLLSGSTDGLVSISNAEESDEDEAVLYVGNLGSSISQTGWISAGNGTRKGVWAATDMETFSLYPPPQLDLNNDFDIRGPSVHTQTRTWVTDYLIGCHTSDDSGLSVLVGSNEGDIALLRNADFHNRTSPWSLERVWTGHHKGVVRSALLDERANVLLTGGEDAVVLAWSCAPLPKEASEMAIDGNPGSSVLGKRDHGQDTKMKNYSHEEVSR
ncbi:WD40 repeat-like protein [Lactarius vividus]|nr:WD40 repeat-like protein [Lactarius vividus]